MSNVKYTELDFAAIKSNLKNFLKSQDKFKDYDFDGSSMSILLDVLAYNTSYNAFYLNMLASEMFLDSASLRESVNSRAKHLGYTPRSVNTSKAKVNILIKYTTSIPTDLLLTTDYEFYTVAGLTRYSFFPLKATYLNLHPTIPNAVYADNVELVEGQKFTHKWTVDLTAPVKQRYVIPNKNVDLKTVSVSVQKSASNTSSLIYSKFEDLTLLTPDDTIYFVQPYEKDLYEIVFGDGVLGKALEQNNIVTISYVVSSGDAVTGSKSFIAKTGVGLFQNCTLNINAVEAAQGYTEQESIDSIKLLAPRSYESQNRAVTKLDYETLLKKDIPIIKHIRVWGGEENDPPNFGRIYCAIKPTTGYALNEEDKKSLLETYIKPRNMVSLEVELVEPDYVGMILNTTVNYFSYKTNKTADTLKSTVLNAIKQHRDSVLVGFDSDFRHSRLLHAIDAADDAIESNITEVTLKYKLIPALDTLINSSIVLNNAVTPSDVKSLVNGVSSDEFIYNSTRVRLADDGAGVLYLYYLVGDQRIVVVPNVGSIDYSTGKTTLKNLLVSGIPNRQNYINIYFKPKLNDVVMYRNQMLLLEDSDILVNMVDLTRVRLS